MANISEVLNLNLTCKISDNNAGYIVMKIKKFDAKRTQLKSEKFFISRESLKFTSATSSMRKNVSKLEFDANKAKF